MKEVYNGNIAFVNGINDVPVELAEPYEYTGKNLVVVMTMDYSQGNGGYFDRFLSNKHRISLNAHAAICRMNR